MERQIEAQGFFTGGWERDLVELTVAFDCCKWIQEQDQRVKKKTELSVQIDAFVKANPVSKRRLLLRHQTGSYIALFAAIRLRPEQSDSELIFAIRTKRLEYGFAYWKLLEAVESLKDARKLSADQLNNLKDFLSQLPDVNRSPQLMD